MADQIQEALAKKAWGELVQKVREKATKENTTQQIVLKKVEGEEFRYTVSLMSNPGRVPFIALSIVRITGRGAWGLALSSTKEIDELIEVLQQTKKELGGLIDEANRQYKEAVKQLKRVVTYDANGSE